MKKKVTASEIAREGGDLKKTHSSISIVLFSFVCLSSFSFFCFSLLGLCEFRFFSTKQKRKFTHYFFLFSRCFFFQQILFLLKLSTFQQFISSSFSFFFLLPRWLFRFFLSDLWPSCYDIHTRIHWAHTMLHKLVSMLGP